MWTFHKQTNGNVVVKFSNTIKRTLLGGKELVKLADNASFRVSSGVNEAREDGGPVFKFDQIDLANCEPAITAANIDELLNELQDSFFLNSSPSNNGGLTQADLDNEINDLKNEADPFDQYALDTDIDSSVTSVEQVSGTKDIRLTKHDGSTDEFTTDFVRSSGDETINGEVTFSEKPKLGAGERSSSTDDPQTFVTEQRLSGRNIITPSGSIDVDFSQHNSCEITQGQNITVNSITLPVGQVKPFSIQMDSTGGYSFDWNGKIINEGVATVENAADAQTTFILEATPFGVMAVKKTWSLDGAEIIQELESEGFDPDRGVLWDKSTPEEDRRFHLNFAGGNSEICEIGDTFTNLGTDDFAMVMLIRLNQTSTANSSRECIIGTPTASGLNNQNCWAFYHSTGGQWECTKSTVNGFVAHESANNTDDWQWIVLNKSGANIEMSVMGEVIGTFNNVTEASTAFQGMRFGFNAWASASSGRFDLREFQSFIGKTLSQAEIDDIISGNAVPTGRTQRIVFDQTHGAIVLDDERTANAMVTAATWATDATNYATIVNGNCYEVNGVDREVIVDNPGITTGNFMFSAWVYINSGANAALNGVVGNAVFNGSQMHGIAFMVDSMQCRVLTGGTGSTFGAIASFYSSAGLIRTAGWHHVGVVREGTGADECYFVIDGVIDEVTRFQIPHNIDNGNTYHWGRIGHTWNANRYPLRGKTMDNRILTAAPTSEQIGQILRHEGNIPNTYCSLAMSDGAGGIAKDRSGNGNHGRVRGTGWGIQNYWRNNWLNGFTAGELSSFNGTNSRIVVPNSTDYHFGTGDFYMCSYARITTGSQMPIWNLSNGGAASDSAFIFWGNSGGGNLGLYLSDGVGWDVNTNANFANDGDYHFFEAWRTGNTIAVFIDGQQHSINTTDGGIDLGDSGRHMEIGAQDGAGWMNGDVQHAAFFNRIPTVLEREALRYGNEIGDELIRVHHGVETTGRGATFENTSGDSIYTPALDDGSGNDVHGGLVSNPSGDFNNGCENQININPGGVNTDLTAATPSIPADTLISFNDTPGVNQRTESDDDGNEKKYTALSKDPSTTTVNQRVLNAA